ncbi:ubiquinone biosynthesis accessory factor UbiJ [Vibrio sp. RC27]
MPVTPLITASIEVVLNRLIQDDPALGRQLARMKGKVIQLHLKELSMTLTFVFSQQIDVLADYEGDLDCYLSLSLATFPQLKEQANITQLIKQDKLILEGDMQLAQKFAQLMSDSKPDLEEWLSRLTGDVVSHTLCRGVKSVNATLKSSMKKHQSHLAQAITEEWRIAPAPLEIAHFCDQVDDVASQFARIESRFRTITDKV